MDEYKIELKKRILERIDFIEDISDEEIQEIIDDTVLKFSREKFLSVAEKQELSKGLFNGIRRLDILQELVDDPSITEIMINGWKDIFVEIDGVITRWNKHFESKEKLEDIIQQMVSKSNRTVNEANPIVDARLEDGSRVHVVLYPIALNGPCVTIRKFPGDPITMEKLIEYEAITREAAQCLEKLVKAKYNLLLSGSTGSGKTTLLNVLSNYIPPDERVITMEDSAELQIKAIPNLVSLETKDAQVEGSRSVTMENLIKASLRMRPDRLVFGEVRDGDAVINMLQAMNTGAAGLSTGHANSARDMLGRLETLALMGMNMPLLAARKQVASAIDIIVHLGRLRDKTRRILEITEVADCVGDEVILNPLFEFKEEGEQENKRVNGKLVNTGNILMNQEKLERAGLIL